MIEHILFVYPDAQQDFYENLREVLEKELNCESMTERNIKRAKKSIQGKTRFDLVIAHIECPLEPKSSPYPEAGFVLEKWLHNNGINIPLAIIVPRYSNAMAVRVNKSLTQIIENDIDLTKMLISFALEHTARQKELDIVLNLSAIHPGSDWRYIIRGRNFPDLKEYSGHLKKLKDIDLKNIIHFSKKVDKAEHDDWDENVGMLCDNLKKFFIDDNDEFRMNLKDALRRINTLNSTHVRFIVDKDIYPALLEAVPYPDLEDNDDSIGGYWMEHAPLVRYVSDRRKGHTLYQEEERIPINILIIGSNTAGPVKLDKTNAEISLDNLANVNKECTELGSYLKKLKKGGINLGEILVIPSTPEELVGRKTIQQALESQLWHIVHYAGHSHYDNDSGQAYIFLKDEDGYVDPLKIEEFAGFLRKTKLLVLSSCTSAHQGFVFELAKHQVPAVLGYRTEIKDEYALRFTRDFYRILFDLKSVERAFYQARKNLYDDEKTRRAWTNPVLVLEGLA